MILINEKAFEALRRKCVKNDTDTTENEYEIDINYFEDVTKRDGIVEKRKAIARLVDKLPKKARQWLVHDYAVLAARAFRARHHNFREYIILGKAHPLGPVTDWFERIESQARGTLHAHSIRWSLLRRTVAGVGDTIPIKQSDCETRKDRFPTHSEETMASKHASVLKAIGQAQTATNNGDSKAPCEHRTDLLGFPSSKSLTADLPRRLDEFCDCGFRMDAIRGHEGCVPMTEDDAINPKFQPGVRQPCASEWNNPCRRSWRDLETDVNGDSDPNVRHGSSRTNDVALNEALLMGRDTEEGHADVRACVLSRQLHRCGFSCLKYGHGCRYGFPKLPTILEHEENITHQDLLCIAPSISKRCMGSKMRTVFNLWRTLGFVSNYTAHLLRAWRGNIDTSFIVDPMGAATYSGSYSSKADTPDKVLLSYIHDEDFRTSNQQESYIRNNNRS